MTCRERGGDTDELHRTWTHLLVPPQPDLVRGTYPSGPSGSHGWTGRFLEERRERREKRKRRERREKRKRRERREKRERRKRREKRMRMKKRRMKTGSVCY